MKRCNTCNKTKPLTDFYRNKRFKKDGHEPRCKNCYNEAKPATYKANRLAYYHKNATAIRFKRILKTYNITESDYKALFIKQNNCCAVCKISQTNYGRDFDVDHCHATNKVRGLLCNSCNQALGLFKDNSIILRNALAYLDYAN